MTLHPFDAWSRWLDAGSAIATTHMRLAETFWASGEVITRRTALMGADNPAETMVEAARMVSEKHSGKRARP